MIITIGNTKGGVGKTTLAIQMATGLLRSGQDVIMVDGDRQGTAGAAIQARGDAGIEPMLPCIQLIDGPQLRQQVQLAAKRYKHVVIDVGGRDSTALRAALTLADRLVIPIAPRTFDVWSLSDIAALVEEARSVRDGLDAAIALNLADPGDSLDNREALEAARAVAGMRVLEVAVRRRKSISNAAAAGLNIQESPQKDRKAIDEVSAFIEAAMA